MANYRFAKILDYASWFGWVLTAFGFYLLLAFQVPNIRIFTWDAELLPYFSLIFLELGFLWTVATKTLASHTRLVDVTITNGVILSGIVKQLLDTGSIPVTPKPLLDALRKAQVELKRDLDHRVAEVERRLRSEWRFVASLVTAILLGAIAVFLAIKH